MNNRKLVIELLALHSNKAYGYQQYVLNLLDYFYENRSNILYPQIIILCKDTESSLLSKYVDRFDIRTYRANYYLYRLFLQTYLPLHLKLGKEDLLLSPGNTSGLLKRCRTVLVVHDLLFKRKQWINRYMRWQRELFVPMSIKNADKIIAISFYTAKDVVSFYPQAEGKVLTIYNFMNFEKFGNRTNDGSDNKPYFLAVSMGAVFKNLQTIFRAFEYYCKEGGEFNLVLIGLLSPDSVAGHVLSKLPEKVRERIVIKSNITNEELGFLYSKASCFISASLFEGLGMPVVEAMSFDCPVLLSDTEVHREVSLNKGEYFNPYDEKELAFKMKNMNYDRRSYSKEIKQLFSQENTSAKYIELINEIYKN